MAKSSNLFLIIKRKKKKRIWSEAKKKCFERERTAFAVIIISVSIRRCSMPVLPSPKGRKHIPQTKKIFIKIEINGAETSARPIKNVNGT